MVSVKKSGEQLLSTACTVYRLSREEGRKMAKSFMRKFDLCSRRNLRSRRLLLIVSFTVRDHQRNREIIFASLIER